MSQRSGWIFSGRTDFIVFWLPVIAAYAVGFAYNGAEPFPFSSINFILGLAIFDASHVISTAGPVYRRHIEGKITRLLKGLLIFTVLLAASYTLSRQLFFSIVAPFAIYHVMKQQFGWVMFSRRKFGEPAIEGRLWDQIIIWNVMLMPVIWWLSPMSAAQKSYYVPNDFYFTIPKVVAQAFFAIYWIINAAYIAHIVKMKRSVNWAKLALLAATSLWFFGLVLFPTKNAFFASLFYVHGVAYILHARRDFSATPFHSKPKSATKIGFWFANRIVPYLLIIVSVGVIWRYGGTIYNDVIVQGGQGSTLEFLMWYPLMVHYYFDSFIWRGLELPALPA